ncbi:GDP-fucose transporter 1 [Asimina triloba]
MVSCGSLQISDKNLFYLRYRILLTIIITSTTPSKNRQPTAYTDDKHSANLSSFNPFHYSAVLGGKKRVEAKTHREMSPPKQETPPLKRQNSTAIATTTTLVVGYALSSSLLSIINKVAITKFNYPTILTAFQYSTSTLGVFLLGKFSFLYHDPLSFETARKFLPAATLFYLAIFANTNLLRHANVDTFIVFRSLTPILVAVADTVFRRQPFPSKLTFLSLMIILAGAVGYVITDSTFTLTAYSWAVAYLITITTEMVYIKHMVMNLSLNTWGFVFYNNFLSLMMAPVFWFLSGEYKGVFSAVESDSLDRSAIFAVAASCVFGLLISFFGFAARKAVSATAFTVTGVVNKFLTVAINLAIWDKHASCSGLLCLLCTIVGGVFYQQSVSGSSGGLLQKESSMTNKLLDIEDGAGGLEDEKDQGMKL